MISTYHALNPLPKHNRTIKLISALSKDRKICFWGTECLQTIPMMFNFENKVILIYRNIDILIGLSIFYTWYCSFEQSKIWHYIHSSILIKKQLRFSDFFLHKIYIKGKLHECAFMVLFVSFYAYSQQYFSHIGG
jgi:hypothetical protein